MTAVAVPGPQQRRVGLRARVPAGRITGPFPLIFLVVLGLNALGLIMVLSTSSVTGLYEGQTTWYTFQRQVVWALFGLVAMFVVMRIDYRRWQKYSIAGVAGAGFLLLVVLIPGLGSTSNGATRWIVLGPLSLQPSEIAKLAMVLFAAAWLADRAGQEHETRVSIRPVLCVFTGMALLILLQPNLGTTVILGLIAFAILFVAGVPLPSLTGWSLLSLGAAILAAIGSGYRRERLVAVLDPWDDPLDTGYQTIQSLVGIASGGTTGVGLGSGRAKWGFLPFAHTDFIFAVLAEELGWLGAVFVIILFVLLGLCGIAVALRSPDRFGQLLAVGITVWLVVQAFVNMAAVTGVMPITGVPLPFLSVGGSALVVNMIAVGILLNISKQSRAGP